MTRLREVERDARALVRDHLDAVSKAERHYYRDECRDVQEVYLGSILNLSPSGKVYMPWATGNLEFCPRCKGHGSMWKTDRWDPLCQYKVECSWCGGLGCREAWLDQHWREALEREAEKHDCYIAAGEGDACDLFLGREN